MGRLWLITCDRCGVESEPHRHKLEVLTRARAAGWHLKSHVRGDDFCPDCYAAGPGRVEPDHG
jgi:hypothetical protein